MTARTLGLLCVVALVVPALAQSTRPAGQVEYVGVLVGTDVNVRSGPGTDAYRCTRLSLPARVEVVARMGDWLKILPPPGCFSVIAKDYVRTDVDGKTGTITGENVRVRAGGELPQWDRVTDFSTEQLKLNTGDRVRIIGQRGDYYRIACPSGAYFYIFAKYVEPVGRTGNGSETVTTSTATSWPTTQRVTPPPIDQTPAVSAIADVDKLLKSEYEKPLVQRDLEGLLAKYKAIDVAEGTYAGKVLADRIRYVQATIQERKDLREVEDLIKRAAQRQEELEKQRMKIEVGAPTTRPITAYTAEGVLVPSEMFPGSAAVPKRYTVRDPQTNRITAYVQCTTTDVDLADYSGKYVGIQGTTSYDVQLELEVVEARKVIVLSKDVRLPAPPAPIVHPLPAPAPPVIEPTRPIEPAPQIKPAPETKPTVKPAPEIEPTVEPAPEIEPTVELAPETKPVVEPAPETRPTVEPTPETKPVVEPAPETRPTVETAPETKPAVEPTPETKPVFELPADPVPPAPAIPPVEKVSGNTVKPLPVADLEVVVPQSQPTTNPVVDEEYK